MADDKYTTKELSNDPADYITGPRKGQANRGHGGTTQDGGVAVLNVEEPDDNPGQTSDSTGAGEQSSSTPAPAPSPEQPVQQQQQRVAPNRR